MNQLQNPRTSETNAQSPLLLIDDDVKNLILLQRMLGWAGYANLHSCTSGAEGLEAIASLNPDVVILDLNMPGMDGYECLAAIRTNAPSNSFLPVLVFTADLSIESRMRALELGASDFLTKPGDAIEIHLRVRNFIEMRRMQSQLVDENQVLENLVRERTEHLTVARREAIEVLASACEYRDDETGQHARRVGNASAKIATELGLDQLFVEHLELVAPLHDVGKIGISDALLYKPGKLTEEEFDRMKLHSELGAKLLGNKTSPLLKLAEEIAMYHHERWDGTGYGIGLAGENIPISARIVAVADAFDAMTHDRPYRSAMGVSKAMEELRQKAGTQFDPQVVRAFEAAVRLSCLEEARGAA